MAKDKVTGEVVAIKKIRSLNEVQGVSAAVFCSRFGRLFCDALFLVVAPGHYNS